MVNISLSLSVCIRQYLLVGCGALFDSPPTHPPDAAAARARVLAAHFHFEPTDSRPYLGGGHAEMKKPNAKESMMG